MGINTLNTDIVEHDWHYGPGSTYWFEGYFGLTEDEMIKWCQANCFGEFMVVQIRITSTFAPCDKLHIKLVDEKDIVLFKLTWL